MKFHTPLARAVYAAKDVLGMYSPDASDMLWTKYRCTSSFQPRSLPRGQSNQITFLTIYGHDARVSHVSSNCVELVSHVCEYT